MARLGFTDDGTQTQEGGVQTQDGGAQAQTGASSNLSSGELKPKEEGAQSQGAFFLSSP